MNYDNWKSDPGITAEQQREPDTCQDIERHLDRVLRASVVLVNQVNETQIEIEPVLVEPSDNGFAAEFSIRFTNVPMIGNWPLDSNANTVAEALKELAEQIRECGRNV